MAILTPLDSVTRKVLISPVTVRRGQSLSGPRPYSQEVATPGQAPGPVLAPGWENLGQLTVQMPSCSLSLHPGPTLGLTPTVRDCIRLIQAGGLSGDQPLPATVEKARTKSWGSGSPKRQKQDWSSAPQVCAHPPLVPVSFYFPLSLGRGGSPLLLKATPLLHLLSSWSLGTPLQTPALVPCLLCG